MGKFPNKIKEKALLACKRHCVICEQNKGKAIECHHIKPKADGGEDIFDNCIPLCFDCHQMIGSYNPKHPKGNKFTESELIIRRDDFYRRVENGEFPKCDMNNTNFIPNNISNKPNKYDIELFEKIKNIFNSPNLEYYLTEYDLGNDFDNNIFSPLMELLYLKDNPEFKFVDKEIENYRIKLINIIYEFISYKAINTFPTEINTQAIKTWKNYKFSDKERQAINGKFNYLATSIWQKYCDLVQICRYKLC